jgi:hypothetical protein
MQAEQWAAGFSPSTCAPGCALLSRCRNDTAYQRIADVLLGEGRMEWVWPEDSDEEDEGQQQQQQQQQQRQQQRRR